MNYKLVVSLIFVGFVLVELWKGRLLHLDKTTPKDVIIEAGAGLILPTVTVPAVLWASAQLTEWAVPGRADSLADWPLWLMIVVLLVLDDLTQYWWHRMSHTWPWLYRLHRAHHSGEYMSVRVVYRNNLLYYAFMPGLWLSGGLLYLGFAPAYYGYFIAKMAVITAAHSSVAWDERLLQIRWLRPVMWVVVRTISTPCTHAAHHGKHEADGVTHYKGNFGNFLFFWDVVFGTAKITGRRPEQFGLENVQPATWQQELLWPFGRRRSDG